MFDIDKYLEDIRISELNPTEELLARTKRRCEESEARKKNHTAVTRRIKKAALIVLPAAAVIAAIIVIGTRFLPVQNAQPEAVAYYTVDINPSLCVNVDAKGQVTDLVGQNEDAQALLDSLNCVGKPVGDAIRQIISAAQDAGYFSEGQRYVLIGCFGADGTAAQSTLGGLQAQLEADFGDMFDLLIVSGTLEDKQMADTLRVSAGLLKLSQLAQGVEVSDGDKLEDILDEVTQVNQKNYSAPALSVGGDAQHLKFTWNTLDFGAMGFTGKVKYHIAMGDTSAEIVGLDGKILETVSFNTYGAQTTSMKLNLAGYGLQPGDSKYFGIYAEYGGVTVACSPVYYTVPAAEPTPPPTASEPRQPEPSVTPEQPAEHTVSGHVSGQYVMLSWVKEARADFVGYKIVASRTNASPSYPSDGYIKYITNADTTSIKLYAGYGGLKADTHYYFSVTYLYNDGSTKAANAVKLRVPSQEHAEEPRESEEVPRESEEVPRESEEPRESEVPAGDYVSSKISGYVSEDGKIHLSWDKVTHSGFGGYKVMYSFTDSTPVYGESGCKYAYWITDSSNTSRSLTAGDIYAEAGQTVYFSITVLYEGDVKKAGNAISLVMPKAKPPGDYAASSISGSIDGTTVHLSWSKVDDERFAGYKVVCSFSDSSPQYPDNGYLRYITNPGDTSCSVDITELDGYASGATCYFSITVLYNGDVRKAGNVYSVSYTEPET